jgi:hypothetical protein
VNGLVHILILFVLLGLCGHIVIVRAALQVVIALVVVIHLGLLNLMEPIELIFLKSKLRGVD